ncbi:alpha/beta hydrolase family protein [Flavobacterium agrisoli]|uniref:Alpha/beta hydrolase n=1 Tax=Flavobacterium agrisoli TaxID=2793066 RepID=A0A934PMP2_9FLAO|nr:alpha/beta hydrolase [Flavobacterium agrisoli]MBK0369758.1 alpha/beta hydrolase [Flavobacterium agrisoli]
MKIFSVLFFSLFVYLIPVHAQEITGKWNGLLKVPGAELRLVFNVTQTEAGLKSTMDSPDQNANGIPVTKTTFEKPQIKFEVGPILYLGELKGDEIIGVFKQSGQEFPLNLSKKTIEKKESKKSQEPIKPYSYFAEDVNFTNAKANISLAGTLTLPKNDGVFPAVILISGSGPQNRNEELAGHKPFLVIADYLTKSGFAVLRFDDRGVGNSTGNFASATTANFATDVESALSYLKTRKEINSKQIGLIGHSEGGIIAPMVAVNTKEVAFIVLLAGTGIPGDELLLLQQSAISKASGKSESEIEKTAQINQKAYQMVMDSQNTEQLKKELQKYLEAVITEVPNGMNKEQFITAHVQQLTSPWARYFLKYNPALTLEKVKCPVLAINGAKDTQVPSKENLNAIEKALQKGNNKDFTTHEFANTNHLFQECETGLPSEYATIEQTFSPIVLDYMNKWMHSKTK